MRIFTSHHTLLLSCLFCLLRSSGFGHHSYNTSYHQTSETKDNTYHYTFCYKSEEHVESGTHVACHGYTEGPNDYSLRKATFAKAKPDSTIKKNGQPVLPARMASWGEASSWPGNFLRHEIAVQFRHVSGQELSVAVEFGKCWSYRDSRSCILCMALAVFQFIRFQDSVALNLHSMISAGLVICLLHTRILEHLHSARSIQSVAA